MNKKTSVDFPDQINKKDELSLPSFSNCFESVLNNGELLQVAGTNVVRVPFGVRQPRNKGQLRFLHGQLWYYLCNHLIPQLHLLMLRKN